MMSNKRFVSMVGALAIASAAVGAAQLKPATSRTSIVVYKSPT
jgi:hypothetical protein